MPITEDHKENQVYELGYLVLPSIPEDGLSDMVTRIKKVIKDAGATELDGEEPIHLDLAYTMSKIVGAKKYVADEAYMGWIKFECEPSTAPSVKAGVDKFDEILRTLLIKTPRETTFTFADAKKAIMDAQAAAAAPAEEAEKAPDAPSEPVVE